MIEIKERAKIITKGLNFSFKNNEDLERVYKKQGKILPEKTDAEIDKNVKDLGRFPYIWIDGVIVEINNISVLKLYNNSFMPKLKFEFTDPTCKIIDENFPRDNSIVSLFKDSTVKDMLGIKMDFKITDFTIIKGKEKSHDLRYKIDAILDVDDFYLMNFESYKGSSFNVIKDLSLKMGLGFATNISNTNDDMVWINPSNYKIEFIRDIINRSYIDDNTFLFGYIDFYYNFNYVDIEKQLKEDISDQMNLINKKAYIKDEEDIETPLILTNNPDAEHRNLFISKYTLLNNSTNINLQYGYRYYANYYDKNEDKINNYALDSITDDEENNIVLKGNSKEKDTLYDNMYSRTWLGSLDTDNVHKNYLHCILQNKNNLKFLQKLKMTVKLSKINYGLYRFQKVLIELYNMGKVNKQEERSTHTGKEIIEGAHQYDDRIIHKLSGEWLITSINITFSKENGNEQELTLVKRELTKNYNFPRRESKKKD